MVFQKYRCCKSRFFFFFTSSLRIYRESIFFFHKAVSIFGNRKEVVKIMIEGRQPSSDTVS